MSRTLSIMKGVMGSVGVSSGTVKTSSDFNSEGSASAESASAGRAAWMHRSMSALPRPLKPQDQTDAEKPLQRSASQEPYRPRNVDESAPSLINRGPRSTVNFGPAVQQEPQKRRQDISLDTMSPRVSSFNMPRRNSCHQPLRTSDGKKGIRSAALGDNPSSASISLRFPPSMTGMADDERGSGVGSLAVVGNGGMSPACGVVIGTGSNFQLLPFVSVGNGSNDQGSGSNSDANGSASQRGAGGAELNGRHFPSPGLKATTEKSSEIPADGFAEVYGEKVPQPFGGGLSCHEVTARMMPNILGHG